MALSSSQDAWIHYINFLQTLKKELWRSCFLCFKVQTPFSFLFSNSCSIVLRHGSSQFFITSCVLYYSPYISLSLWLPAHQLGCQCRNRTKNKNQVFFSISSQYYFTFRGIWRQQGQQCTHCFTSSYSRGTKSTSQLIDKIWLRDRNEESKQLKVATFQLEADEFLSCCSLLKFKVV